MNVTRVTRNISDNDQFDKAPRIVKPRRRVTRKFPVMAICQDYTLTEDGEQGYTDDLPGVLRDMPPTLFAKQAAADFVGYLNGYFLLHEPDRWQWRAATHEREIVRPDGVRVASQVSTIIHYFGFKGGNYHKIIDPISMYGHRLSTIWPSDEPEIVTLLQWAIALRDFCAENHIDVRPTTGGISAQFLTDPRFYPNARRKVPAATNEQTRERMPGNYYYLNTHPTPHRDYSAYYLDQRRAHHYHARTTELPHADQLYAYGRFTDLSDVVFPDTSDDFYGLYCLDLEAPATRPFYHWLPKGKLDKQFVWSNELPHLRDMGYRVIGVRAAWGSLKRDTGLPAYAAWCEEQLDKHGDPKWLKPILLSAYGTLATKPKCAETVFRLCKGGEAVTLRTGHRRLNGKLTKGKHKLEPRIANVLHRGMIEAATRSESVGLSQWLDYQGYTVLSIYADAVIVEADDDHPLPIIPEPWRLKQTLNHLQFINQQAFISDGMTKLPGVNRELRDYRQNMKPGYAPRRVATEALTERRILTNRRI